MPNLRRGLARNAVGGAAAEQMSAALPNSIGRPLVADLKGWRTAASRDTTGR
jgi:hypothetical protein